MTRTVLPEVNILRACLAAPIVAPVATLLIGPLVDPGINLAMAPLVFIATLVIAYVAMLVVALPMALVLRNLGLLSAPVVILVAATLTAFIAFAIGVNFIDGMSRSDAGALALLSGAVATCVAVAWCLAADLGFRSISSWTASR